MSKVRRFGFLYAAVLSVFLVSAGGERALAAGKKPSCVTDKCHSGMGKEKFVHGPVATGDCLFCHQQVGKHKFKPTPKHVSDLCYQCHDRMDTMKTVHPPVKAGECTKCHSPHQSSYKYQLRAGGSDLCFQCHNKSLMGGKFQHGPAATGQCTVCHNPHQSDNPRMLFAVGNNVCFSCHTDKADQIKSSKHVHPAVEEGCINCHSPHSANYKYNLIADGTEALCLTCHTGKKDQIAAATTKHGALETGKKCLNCHDPHATNYAKMLRMQPMDLCLSCHNKSYNTPTGVIMDMKAYLAKNKDWHGPIRQKDCVACHDPHGSSNWRMLRAYFPPTFYSNYDPKNYALCFMCHEKTIPSQQWTTTLTNFRNGNENLHYLHVNKLKGRTCKICHDPHASNNPKHIRDYVPFGAWKLPINYKKTATGGQCSPGCHQTFRYDRVNPVKNR
ncbi:MAG: hypothetical protein M0Z48_00840 [Nitrospiraceae bacterium]|nr:hypothetical protein [Nitrospiraceae bacterium]